MTDKTMYRRIWLWFIGILGALVFLLVSPKVAQAAAKDAETVPTLEKKIMAASTKTILYQKGKGKSAYSPSWKKAKKLPLTAAEISIRKKGWYSLLVKTQNGKRKVVSVYFQAKTYAIPCNTSVKQKAGYYYVVPKSDKTRVAEVQNASLSKKAKVSAGPRGDSACRIWKLEPAGGSKFRLKNINSGLYLSDTATGSKEGNAVQKAYSAKNEAQIFRAYSAGGTYTYLRCLGTKKYLHMDENRLVFASRKANKTWKFKLEETTCPDSLVTISGGTYPSAIQEGAAFVLKGTVNSRYTMKTLTVRVLDSTGNAVLAKSVKPNSCTYNIKNIDAAITFGKLPAGQYTYWFAVTDTTGKETVWVNQVFSVIAPMTTMGPKGNASSQTLSYNSNLIQAIGHQSTGDALEKKACASYALAYCNAVLYGSAPSPRSYWISSTNVDCVWSKGGYTCSSTGYGSELAVLQAAYTQIMAGNPCILNVTGSTTDQHWLCVIGYKSVSTVQTLKADNFIAIDPWDGAVITVSDKYKVKNTYRLAIKN